jgi:hypothetical protein
MTNITRAAVRRTSILVVPLLALAACSGSSGGSASGTAQTSPSASASQASSASPSAAASASPADESAAPSASEAAAGGIALEDVDLQRLLDAFASFGFEVDDAPDEGNDGDQIYRARAEDGEVELSVRENEGDVREVLVADYSAGDVGLEELGFLIGIFAPEAESWLVDQVEEAVADPGTPMEATMDFEHVTLVFEAFTDDTQSIDLYVREK